jgi:DNA-binding HxlR family transcriptional regulator
MALMQRIRFTAMDCPIARSLDRVGEWWSILILRDALGGMTRFEEFQKSLKIAPNLTRRRYSEHPPRHEYIVTERGRDFRSVLIALIAFGNRHFAPEGASVAIVDAVSGAPAEPILVDRPTGRPIVSSEFELVAGPAASEAMKARMANRAARLLKSSV